jgi:WS/DGAT/MGAT family acyltransferase
VIERISSTDLMELAADFPGAPAQVAAVLVLGTTSALPLAEVSDVLAERVQSVPRLRQRLVRVPFGCGRPVWVDDPDFSVQHHVDAVSCPAPGDEAALLAVAADTATRRLPADRPLWSATLVTGLADGGTALIVVLHHVVADGMGGLAVLANLVDGLPVAPGCDFPRPAPGHLALFRDACGTRWRALRHFRAGARRLRSAAAELASGTARPPRSSLNQPTGSSRSLAVARADLAAVKRAAHADGATVNDVVLAAVTGALHTVLRHRGEAVDRFVVSVPTSARHQATATHLGNQTGVMLVPVTVTGDRHRRLTAIAETTRRRRPAAPGSSADVVGLALRALARLGALQWFVNRQRLVTTLVSNLRGPDARLSFLAAPVTTVIPVLPTSGNVTVLFAVLSYAGTLVVTVVADRQRWPDLELLVGALQGELDLLCSAHADQADQVSEPGV